MGGNPFFCLENKNLYFEESPKLQLFLGANQNGSLQKLGRHPKTN
jgi:hypothetical protein